MDETRPQGDLLRLIRFASFLWLGYLAILALVNIAFLPPPRPPAAPSVGVDYLYYIALGAIAVVCLAISYARRLPELLGRWFAPVLIIFITIAPFLVHFLMIRYFPLSPQFSREGPVLSLLPFSFISLMLVAWRYRWHYTLLVIFGIAGLNLGLQWYFSGPGTASFQGGIVITLTQVIIFLALGFSISFLISRLRDQQRTLEAANLRLTHYASTLEELTVSRERNRLARELHDTLAHALSGLSVQLETLKAYWDVDQAAARSILDTSLEAAHSGLEETRRALKALRASVLEDRGLGTALGLMAREAASRAGLKLDLTVAEELPALSPDVEQGIYRIAQEAVTNAVKHARATTLTITLTAANPNVRLVVRDDGVGYNPEEVGGSAGLGLTGMKERAQLMGADLKITSAPGGGTSLEFSV